MVRTRHWAPARDDQISQRRVRHTAVHDRRGHIGKRAAIAAVITVAALTAGGCGTSTNPTSNFRIPNLTSQDLLQELGQPTSRGPGGYEMLSGPQHLSLRGIQYTIQGRDALQSWLNSPPSKRAAYQQAGRNLAIAFPANRSEIEGKLQ